MPGRSGRCADTKLSLCEAIDPNYCLRESDYERSRVCRKTSTRTPLPWIGQGRKKVSVLIPITRSVREAQLAHLVFVGVFADALRR